MLHLGENLRKYLAGVHILNISPQARSQDGEKRLLSSSCLSVLLSIRMEQLGSQSTDFHEKSSLRTSRKSVEKVQVSLKPDKNTRYFKQRLMYIYDSNAVKFLRKINVSDRNCRENQNTYFTFNFFFENGAVYKIMWKRKYDRAGQTTNDNAAHALCMPDN